MTARFKKNAKRSKNKIDDILRRVDRLPILDSRTADEIIGYDEHGIPESPENSRAVESIVPDCPSAVKWPDFCARAKKIFGNRVLPGADLLIKERGRY